ncbi:hypothetical protein BpHYR1_003669 [Brachionus plicatilis]|uniref:Uncharacterized protein n=1 Tax=Brachionus plicatilis TaxID=10195 RepID=A0A3M7R5Q9_BRAPC|nr:hypothetical protein BpHYR1_003669 [Brachionus plicatilis]
MLKSESLIGIVNGIEIVNFTNGINYESVKKLQKISKNVLNGWVGVRGWGTWCITFLPPP